MKNILVSILILIETFYALFCMVLCLGGGAIFILPFTQNPLIVLSFTFISLSLGWFIFRPLLMKLDNFILEI